MSNNKILVTGSAGFIGYHLCKSLVNDKVEILGLDNLNSYYDVNLKISRLEKLRKFEDGLDLIERDHESIYALAKK